jgi:hypothetical protein
LRQSGGQLGALELESPELAHGIDVAKQAGVVALRWAAARNEANGGDEAEQRTKRRRTHEASPL